MNEKAKQALNKVLELFKMGDVPEALSITLLPRLEVPSAKWSICNRLLMFLNGTEDARGFRQWELVGRWPRKGSRAFYILCPRVINKERKDGEKEPVVIGFRAAPVFRYEDTEGKDLQVERIPPPKLPPLYEVAQQWGIRVDWKRYPGRSYGYYCHDSKEIVLATHDEEVFFHELAHAAHAKLLGKLTKVELWRKEVVAELTAAVLGQLYGKRCNTGMHYRYIEQYVQEKDAYHACISVVTEVGECLDQIMAMKEGEVMAKAA